MWKRIFLYLKNFDWVLFASVLLLACAGLIEIYSIALGRDADLANFKKQMVFIGAGVIIVFIVAFWDYQFLRDFGNYLYALGVLLLVAVLIFGETVKGTTGWFDFKYFSIQPVEFVKIILIVFLAKLFSSRKTERKNIYHLLWSGGFVLVLFFLVVLQPDFGSAMLLIGIWVVMVVVSGFNKKYLLLLGVLGVLALAGMWNFYFQDYQKERVLTFLNPSHSSLDQGYNVSQAIIAVGSGGMTGRGVGFGSQSQLKFLPEVQNDFIFAVIGEELGFIGASLLILFFGVFFYRCLANLKNVKNDFGIFLILGITGLIFIQMFINISMNIGIFPVVGIPLPFVSYGGSALIINFIMVGIIENIIIRSKINY